MNDDKIAMPVAKIVTAWAAIGVTSWAEAASFAAFLYTILLIGEWLWKKLLKPWLHRR